MEELERQAGWGTSFGLPLELVSPAEAGRRFPLMVQDDVVGAAFIPTDGYLDPRGLVSPAEAGRRFPLMVEDDVVGAAFIPTDGYLDPSGLALALAEGARRGGARILEGVRVTGIQVNRGAVRGVDTEQGAIETEVIVNAGGI